MSTSKLSAGAGAAAIRFSPEFFPYESFRAVHDDPVARVLLLDCAQRVAIVCLELVMLPASGVDTVKKIVAEKTAAKEENIWVHVTHAITTPHEPHAPMGPGGIPKPITPEEKVALEHKRVLFNIAVEQAVAQAAQTAAETFRPAVMGVGTGMCYVNVNRDISTPHGWWINFNPDGPSNHKATVLRFDDGEGKPIASFISFGLKPCAIDNSEMGKDTRLISSDVPGLACRLLEERFGAPCLFAMSAAGDQVPVEQTWYAVVNEDGTVGEVDNGVQVGLQIVDRLGRQMAGDLAPVLENIVCDRNAPEIRLDQGFIEWTGKERNQMKPTLKTEYIPKGSHRVDVVTMAIGDLALVGVKPEVNTVTEAQLHAASPYEHTLLMSMVNGGFKYMPDIVSYENYSWEAQNCALMPGAAEAWVEEAVRVLNNMQSAKGE